MAKRVWHSCEYQVCKSHGSYSVREARPPRYAVRGEAPAILNSWNTAIYISPSDVLCGPTLMVAGALYPVLC